MSTDRVSNRNHEVERAAFHTCVASASLAFLLCGCGAAGLYMSCSQSAPLGELVVCASSFAVFQGHRYVLHSGEHCKRWGKTSAEFENQVPRQFEMV